MRVLYLSCHSVLEWDELSMFNSITELPIEIFSMGAYSNPTQSGDYMRSVVPNSKFYPDQFSLAMQCDKDNLHPNLVEWADIIISMHNSKLPGQASEQPWIVNNWPIFEKLRKRVIWRSIGQSTPAIELELKKYRARGLKIIRYSPIESYLPQYAGEDAVIRFAKDENDFGGWNGNKRQVVTIAQSFKRRGDHLGYPLFEKITEGFNRKVFGTENADLGEMWGGSPTYNELKINLKDSRVFFYTGTIPAPYTLSFIEAMMTGTPVVAVGSKLREHTAYPWKNYEIPELIINGVNGYVSDNVNELRGYIQLLMEDPDTAKRIGEAGRKTAIKLFNKKERMKEWTEFFKKI